MARFHYQLATVDHIPQIQVLQTHYHIQTIQEKDKKDGFVTTLFTAEQFEALILEEGGLTIALDGDKVVAYVMAASWHYWRTWPLFQHMIEDLKNLSYLGQVLTVDNSYQYGPICIDKAYRSTEVLYEIFEFSRQQMVLRYPVLITFINHINPRSYTAHVDKLGLEVLKSFTFNNNQYYCLAYDTSKPVLVLRQEVPEDYRAVEEVVREAFWNHHSPGCDEHYLLHHLRTDEAFIPALSYVAELEGKIVGQICYTHGHIESDFGDQIPVLCFGPLAVLPQLQGRGIGAKLVAETLKQARRLGHLAVLIYGDPDYYSRLDFEPAENYQIGTPNNDYADPLQIYVLNPDTFNSLHVKGRFFEASGYQIEGEAARAFDLTFPAKQALKGLDSQLRFEFLVKRRRPRIANQ